MRPARGAEQLVRRVAVAGRTVIVIDDGLATGATMVVALQAVRAQGPARLVCAVPVAAPDSLERVAALVDEIVCLATPRPFHSVGQHYLDFTFVTDDEVMGLLARPAASGAKASAPPSGSVQVLELNRAAQAAMPRGADLRMVPGATRLFEEPGALQQVAPMAADWFTPWLQPVHATLT
ncbi:MAG: hypothetical protein EPN69_00840 [Rhodanobacter sp.]|nr:MAG: hypothetical protein EPN69_00840 [Rhodanobacter sp.]TAM03438.1 MAG: hypothetical protein EPN71_03795 [Rhodanobacter sp.]TAM38684.1 MAG: hypothetical protein EPN58_16490 [Rhodanobacter sp.]TAN23709.1 MAG: hypothetical protein EPN32_11065 [Rhodanobacter sp.]